MKDINKLKNYREKYKRHYGIEFDGDYAIHHIDLNRKNNDISNLLLLPKGLHAKYHIILNAISICTSKPKADGFVDLKLSNMLITDYNSKMLDLLPQTISECQKWIKWRDYKYDKYLESFIFDGTEKFGRGIMKK